MVHDLRGDVIEKAPKDAWGNALVSDLEAALVPPLPQSDQRAERTVKPGLNSPAMGLISVASRGRIHAFTYLGQRFVAIGEVGAGEAWPGEFDRGLGRSESHKFTASRNTGLDRAGK